jgi:predicted permease
MFGRSKTDRELDAELHAFVELLTEEKIRAGMSPAEARRAALLETGGIEQVKEQVRDVRRGAVLEGILADARYAVRRIRREAGFTTVAVLTLAIGIGANTTIFTFVNAVLLRPLPYPDSDRLVVLHEHTLNSVEPLNVHPVNFVEWRARARSFDALVLVQAIPLNVMGRDGAEQINRMLTTAELFDVFGAHPVLGRGFTEEETRPGDHQVVVLGYDFWQRWFGGDPSVLGRQLLVPSRPLTIIGVAPPGFRIGSMEPDAFTPLTVDPANPAATGSRAFQCYGRLNPGVSLEAARAEMTVVGSALRREYRLNQGMGVLVSDLHEYLVREARPALRLLMAVVAIVLVIACVNLAGLMMARGVTRRSELAVRAALGASRGRLVRQLVIEGFVLSLCGGAVALALAYWAKQTLLALAAGALTSGTSEQIRLDATCLFFTLAVSTATALAFGLQPSRQASRVDPQAALRERTRGATADRRHYRVRRLLIVTEVALSVVLLVGAGLLLRTLSSLVRVDLGFQPAGTITMGLFLGPRSPEARIAVIDQILDRVESVPGVQAAGTIQFPPLRGMTCGTGFWYEEHAATRNPERALPTECALVSRGYFAAMGIPVFDGRAFDRRDLLASPRVVVVTQSFAKRYFPDGRVLARRLLVQASNQELAEIIGVVGDVRHNGLTTDPAPTVYLLHAQTPGYITNLVVRTSGDPMSYAAAIRRVIQDVDGTQAASAVGSVEQDVAKVLARPRLQAILITAFAIIALLLAAIGVYGLIAYLVSQRTHEIGIRLALGANAARVFFEISGQGMGLVVAGLVIGIAAAVGLREIASSFVFGVSTGDPLTYVLAVLVFSGVALAAVVIPAQRASRIEPITALRHE